MKKSIGEEEFELNGKWLFLNNKLVEDETSNRINYLKNNYLNKVAISTSGWETLYHDPTDNRYWELIFSQSESHGGGASTLINVTKEIAIDKYGI